MPGEFDNLLQENKRLKAACEKAQEEREIYARLHALTGSFIVVYIVDPETEGYREFSATDDYTASFAQAKEGTEFFRTVREAARAFNHPDDMEHFLSAFTKENVMAMIGKHGIFTLDYRVIMEGNSIHVRMKAAMVQEREGLRLIVGLEDQEAQFQRPYSDTTAKVRDQEVLKMVNEYNIRRRFLVSEFNRLGLTCFDPEGAFYVFPCIKSTGLSSEEFAEGLLYSKHVAVVPGTAFGKCGEGFVRVSYSYSVAHIKEALKRIQDFLEEILCFLVL